MLFGHQNDDVKKPDDAPAPLVQDSGINPLAVDPATGASLPALTSAPVEPAEAPEPSILDQPTSVDPVTTAPPVVVPAPQFVTPDPITVEPPAAPVEDIVPDVPAPADPITDLPTADDDDLLSLKQQALTQLSPLVSHLDQTPEEKFRTTMMMIQSTDNQTLIKDAYAAAQAISDEKVRAQALLDIVNEINYFTQPKPNN